jgi:hypothetical protein
MKEHPSNLEEASMRRNSGTGLPTPEDKKRDGEKAMAERRAQEAAVNKNMARLRALRLEREAGGEGSQEEVKKAKK